MKHEIEFYLNARVMPQKIEHDNLKYCPDCERVYETYYCSSQRKFVERRHLDMPTYGLRRECCKICDTEKILR